MKIKVTYSSTNEKRIEDVLIDMLNENENMKDMKKEVVLIQEKAKKKKAV